MLFVVLLPLLSLCSVALSAATNKLVTRDDSNVTITDDQFCGLIVESALEGKQIKLFPPTTVGHPSPNV